jgi:hypothetical protein
LGDEVQRKRNCETDDCYAKEIKSLSYGHSSVQIDTVKKTDGYAYNAKMYPQSF